MDTCYSLKTTKLKTMTTTKVKLIAISGCSSSGKTTLAKFLANAIPGCILIHEDDFYKPDSEIPINEKYGVADWDCPEALDLDAFKRELDLIKTTGSIKTKLIHNENVDDIGKFNIKQEDWDALRVKLSSVIESDLKVVLVDGFMIFNDEELMKKFDIRVFVRAPYEVLRRRRHARAGYKTLESFWVDPPYYFDEFVYRAYREEHKHLFVNEDVEGSLRSDAELFELINDDETEITTALNTIADYIVSHLDAN